MDRTRLQDFRKLLNNLFESGKCYRIEEAMEHINFAKAEISLWMIIDEVPDGRIKKCTQLSMITVKAKLFCPEIAGLFCRIAGLFCHDSRANLSLKPVCFGIAIS